MVSTLVINAEITCVEQLKVTVVLRRVEERTFRGVLPEIGRTL